MLIQPLEAELSTKIGDAKLKVGSASLTDRPSVTMFRFSDPVCPDRPTRSSRPGPEGRLGASRPTDSPHSRPGPEG